MEKKNMEYTIYRANDGLLTKKFTRNAKGSYDKTPACNTNDYGQIKDSIESIKDFCDFIDNIGKDGNAFGYNTAVGYGVFNEDTTVLVSKWAKETFYSDNENVSARTKTNVFWSDGPSVLMFDNDNGNYKLEDLRGILIDIIPEFSDVEMAGYHSTGSFIFDKTKDNKVIIGEKGHKIYTSISSGKDIEPLANYLKVMLWLKGKGHIEISESGSLLERNVFDMSVYSPERFDFVAGAVCCDGFEQKRPKRLLWNESSGAGYFVFDAEKYRVTPILEAQYREAVKAAKEAKKAEAQAVRDIYIETRAKEHAKIKNIGFDEAKLIITNSLLGGQLDSELLLYFSNDEVVTVAEVLENPWKYNGMTLADPIEPTYNNNKTVAKVFVKGNVVLIHSFAHGGKVYHLSNKKTIKIAKQDDETINKCYDVLRGLGCYYHSKESNSMTQVIIENNKPTLTNLNVPRVRKQLQNYINFVKSEYDDKKKKLIFEKVNPPDRMVEGVFYNSAEALNTLNGFSNVPLVRRDFSIFTENGYDKETELYLHCDDRFQHNKNPNEDDLIKALDMLMTPFSEYKFPQKPVVNSILLGFMLTVLTVNSSETRPMLLVSANDQGSGKTKICQMIALLTEGGVEPKMTNLDVFSEEEIAKKELALLMGKPAYIIWDNVKENTTIDSSILSMIATTPIPLLRLLGHSKMIECPNKTIQMFTGNRVNVSSELARRIFHIHIDPEVPNPRGLRYSFNPVDYVKAHRVEMIEALITIMTAYKNAGAPVMSDFPLASFEEWDRMTRQIVLWVANQKWASKYEFVDMMANIDDNFDKSDENERESSLTYDLYKIFHGEPFSVFKIVDIVSNPNNFESISLRDYLKLTLKDEYTNTRKIGGKRGLIKRLINRVFDIDVDDCRVRLRLLETRKSTGGIKWYQYEIINKINVVPQCGVVDLFEHKESAPKRDNVKDRFKDFIH